MGCTKCTITIESSRLSRLRHDRIGLDEMVKIRVVPPCHVEIQSQFVLFQLPGEAVLGRRQAVLPAYFPKCRVADLAVPASILVGGDVQAAQVVGEDPVERVLLAHHRPHRNGQIAHRVELLDRLRFTALPIICRPG